MISYSSKVPIFWGGIRTTHIIKQISNLLLSARSKSGVSQEDLAEALGMSRITVHRIETGSKVPNMAEFIMWYRALGLNWYRDILRLAHPEIYDDFDGSVADIEQKRNGLFSYLAECPPGEVEKLAFLIFGEHGSDWLSMLDEYVANAHCSMRSRAAVCRLVIENYELEEATGELVDPAIAKPNIANLRAAHEAGQHAAQLRRNEYSR